MPSEIKQKDAASLFLYFAQRRDEILGLTRKLCEIESPSGDGEGSRAVVELFTEAARKLKSFASVERTPAPDGYGEHLRLRFFADAPDGDKSILILGHTDTVHPRGTLASRPWREADGRIYAPGVFDMKAGCAVALAALRACEDLDMRPLRPVVFLLTCDEEAGSASGRALVEEEARRASSVLVLEPPAHGGRVKTERKGTGLYTLKVEGRAAHAGLEPEKGASAILEIAKQIERVHAFAKEEQGTTVNVGVVKGGTHANVVPSEAVAEIDVRFRTVEEAKRIDESIRRLRPFDQRVKLSVGGGINRPPMERTRGVANLYELAREAAAALGIELGEASVGGASDGNFAAACGASVLDGLGVEGDGAHAAHEHIIVEGVDSRAALLATLVARL